MEWLISAIIMSPLFIVGVGFGLEKHHKKKYNEKVLNGDLLRELEMIVDEGEVVKKKKELIFKHKKTPLRLLTNGHMASFETITTGILKLYTYENEFKATGEYKIAVEMGLFKRKLEKIYDKIIKKYENEFGTADMYFKNIIKEFKGGFTDKVQENKKYEFVSGNFKMRYAKTDNYFKVQLLMDEDVIWENEVEVNALEVKFRESLDRTNRLEGKVEEYEHEIEGLKVMLKNYFNDSEEEVLKEMKGILKHIENQDEDYQEAKNKVNNIYDTYQSLSKKMKIEKEEEILNLLKEIKKEIKKEKTYLKI